MAFFALEALPKLTVSKNTVAAAGPPAAVRPLVVIGYSSLGDVAVPGPYTSIKTLQSDHGVGSAVEAAAFALSPYGRVGTVHVINAGGSNAGAYGSITATWGGDDPTSVAGDGSAKPGDTLEVKVVFTAAGVVGTTGIKYKFSLDGGFSYFSERDLGTATSITLPYGGGTYNLTNAKDVAVGDTFELSTTGPSPDATQLVAAVRALRGYAGDFGAILFADPMTGAVLNTVVAELQGLWEYGKFRDAVVSFRAPNAGESVATYKAAFATSFGAYSTTECRVCSGGVRQYSPLMVTSEGQSRPLRPPSWWVAAARARSQPETSLQSLEAAAGVEIKDSKGNTLDRCIDEQENAYSVEVRSLGMRTNPQKNAAGVYVTQDITLFGADSPWVLGPYTSVTNHITETVQSYLVSALGRGFPSAPGQPFSEDVRQGLEDGANAIIKAEGEDKGRCTEALIKLSPTAGLNGRVDWEGTIVPLNYNANGGSLVLSLSGTALLPAAA
jgi:hypothetical protein